MDVRIGTTVTGHRVGFDTYRTRTLLLVGEEGRGKTTIARHLARWWLADTTRHAHVLAASPNEWADLRCHRTGLEGLDESTAPLARDCRTGSCLVVVDDLDELDDLDDFGVREQRLEEAVGLLALGGARVVLTCRGNNHSQLRWLERLDDGFVALGLVPRRPLWDVESAVCAGQGRLDWPYRTVPVVCDQRGPLDFPRHSWGAPGREWAVAAR